MILRVFRYTLAPGACAAFESAVVDAGLPRLAHDRELRFALAARSSAETGVVVTAWDRFEAIAETASGMLERPVFLPEAAQGLIALGDVAHYEALDLPPVGSGDAAVLRIMVGDVKDWAEAGYFDWVRTRLWPALAAVEGLAGGWAGRQVGEGGTDPVIGITTWSSRDAIVGAGADTAPFAVDGESGPFRFGHVEVLDLFGVVGEARPEREGPQT